MNLSNLANLYLTNESVHDQMALEESLSKEDSNVGQLAEELKEVKKENQDLKAKVNEIDDMLSQLIELSGFKVNKIIEKKIF